MTRFSPIVIFTYKRLDTLKTTVESLKLCELANESDVFIYSDAAKGLNDFEEVESVRKYLTGLKGFQNITLCFAEANKGLANSIIDGVSSVLKTYGRAIVLEDDLQVSSNFLVFMNSGLSFYESESKVFSISGYSLKVSVPISYSYDVYFTPRGLSWGWATWENRWTNIDWGVNDFQQFLSDGESHAKFARGGTDLLPMLKKQMNNSLDSWAIRWFYAQFKTGQLTVYPIHSKVQNLGFDSRATHTNVYNRYRISFDISGCLEFKFAEEVSVNSQILKSFQNYYSISTRIIYGRIISPMFRFKQYIVKQFNSL